MLKNIRFLPVFIALVSIIPAFANAAEETLEAYWPIHVPQKSWDLIVNSDKNSSTPKTTMTVTNKDSGANQVDMWFSNKPGQVAGASDVEQYEFCSNPGGHPWLFFEGYIDAAQGKLGRSHPVESTRILFTPNKGQTFDLVADGTYARCGNKGQPYLFWNQNLDSYRIQVWGYLTENPKWKWYWEATVTKPAPVTNNCIKPAQTVKALRIQEAWWSNFKVKEGKWTVGTGDTAGDGMPNGTNVKYGRTVWHAQGQLPYYLIGWPDGKTVGQCAQQVRSVTDSGH